MPGPEQTARAVVAAQASGADNLLSGITVVPGRRAVGLEGGSLASSRTESARVGNAHVLAAEGFAGVVESLGLAIIPPPSGTGDSQYEGRGGVGVVDLPQGQGRALVRMYRHGGVSGLLFGAWFAGRSRATREFGITLEAFDAGVPCAQPLAAVTRRTLLLLYRATFVSKEIPRSRDLAALAQMLADGSLDRASATKAAAAAAKAVATMHEKGFLHADLNLKNIVVSEEEGGCAAYVVDFDLSRRSDGALSRACRMRNLMRLERSARKIGRRGAVIPPRLRLRFLREYAAASGMERPSLAELKRWSWFFGRHSLAWLLSG